MDRVRAVHPRRVAPVRRERFEGPAVAGARRGGALGSARAARRGRCSPGGSRRRAPALVNVGGRRDPASQSRRRRSPPPASPPPRGAAVQLADPPAAPGSPPGTPSPRSPAACTAPPGLRSRRARRRTSARRPSARSTPGRAPARPAAPSATRGPAVVERRHPPPGPRCARWSSATCVARRVGGEPPPQRRPPRSPRGASTRGWSPPGRGASAVEAIIRSGSWASTRRPVRRHQRAAEGPCRPAVGPRAETRGCRRPWEGSSPRQT